MNTLANVLSYRAYLEDLFVALQQIAPNAHAEHIHDALGRRIIDEIRRVNEAFPTVTAASIKRFPQGPLHSLGLERAFEAGLEFPLESASYLYLGDFGATDLAGIAPILQGAPNLLRELQQRIALFESALNPLDFEAFSGQADERQATECQQQIQQLLERLEALGGRVLYTEKPPKQQKVHLQAFAQRRDARSFDVLTRKPSKRQKRLFSLINKNSGETVQLWQYRQQKLNRFKYCEICGKRVYGTPTIVFHCRDDRHVRALRQIIVNADAATFDGLWTRAEVSSLAEALNMKQ